MKERIEVIDFKYKIAIWTFIFFLVISFLAPISGADWSSYLIGKEGFIESIKNTTIGDGRIISSFLINVLSYNKILFNLLISGLMSLFVFASNNFLGYVKNKYFYLFPFIGTLIVGVFTFSYNYTAVSSTVVYTIPSILVFLYFSQLWKKETYEFSFKEIILLSLLGLYVSLSSINIGLVFLLGNIIYYICAKVKKKNISNIYIITIIIQILALIFTFTQLNKTFFYSNINASLANIPKYIDTIFSKNIVIIILGAIPINYYLHTKLKNFLYSRVVITLFDAVLVFSLAYNFSYYSPVNINLVINKYFGVFAVENWYYIFYFITYIALFYLSINFLITSKKTKSFFKIFSIMSLVISILLLISPMWDEGNTIFIILFMIMSISLLLKELDVMIYPKVTFLFIIILIGYYLFSFTITKYIDVTRKEYIEEQLNENVEVVDIKANPIYLVWRYNPVNVFQHKDFKSYYNIPNEKSLNVRYFGIFKNIENKVKE